MSSPLTTHFGFTRVLDGEDVSKDGYAPLGRDRDMLDNLLFALFNREFTGVPALGDPTDPPDLTLQPAGGTLPADRTFYYRVAYVDPFGLETAASPELSVDTPETIEAPTAPALSVIESGGDLGPGVYNYVITSVDPIGGETTVSPLSSIQITAGATNSIDIDLPDLDPAAVTMRIYRSRPGQSSLFYIGQSSADTFTDPGLVEDATRLAPGVNSTNATNSVLVETPGAFIPQDAVSWRIYRTEVSGVYDSNSLVHDVVEPATTTSTIPTTTYVDDGGALLAGAPRDVSATAPAAPKLNLANLLGVLPISAVPRGVQCLSAYGPGTASDGDVLTITEVPSIVAPVRFTAYWQTPPTSGQPTIRVSDGSTDIDLICSPGNHRGGDPAGLWRAEYPLMLAATFEAEAGVRSSLDLVIDNDLAASNSQAVQLDSSDDYIDVDLGELDTGSYATFARLRVLAFDSSGDPGDDITISIIRTDTDAVIASTTASIVAAIPTDPQAVDFMYQEIPGPTFTAPGAGVDVALRVAKSTVAIQSYDVDFMRYATAVPTLDPGVVTVSTHVSGSTNGADVNVCLWF